MNTDLNTRLLKVFYSNVYIVLMLVIQIPTVLFNVKPQISKHNLIKVFRWALKGCIQYSIWQRKKNTKSAYTILLTKEQNTWHPKDFVCLTFIHLNKCLEQGPSKNNIYIVSCQGVVQLRVRFKISMGIGRLGPGILVASTR